MVQNVEEIKYEPHHAFVPGTTDMKQVQVGTTGSRLVPQPSDDAADPLVRTSPEEILLGFKILSLVLLRTGPVPGSISSTLHTAALPFLGRCRCSPFHLFTAF
jgi:hypothetical protein